MHARAPAVLLALAAVLAGCAGPAPPPAAPSPAASTPAPTSPAPTVPAPAAPGPAAVDLALEDVPPLAAQVRWRAALPGREGALSSPLLADLDGDGGLEVVQGNGWEDFADGAPTPSRGGLMAFAAAGQARWTTLAGAVDSSPAWGDVTGDGAPEVLVGLRQRGELVLAAPGNGTILARLALANWVHSPALSDVDGDGVRDAVVVTGGLEEASKGPGKTGEVVAVRGPGLEVLWRRGLSDEAYASPAVGSSRPGQGVVLLGLGGQLSAGGAIEARDARDGALRWREAAPTGVLASPILADLDGDGAKEGVFAAWWGTVHVRRATDGAKVWDAATEHLVWTSPALGELSGDGRPDVIVAGYRTPGLHFRGFEQTVNGKFSLSFGNGGLVVAYDGPTGQVLWRRNLLGMVPGSPVTADVTGDGRVEVLLAVALGGGGYFGPEKGALLVLDGATGRALGAIELPHGAVSTPAVGDLDGDGRAEVAVATARPDDGEALVVSFEGRWSPDVPWSWPRWRGNEQGTGEAR